MLCTSNNYNSCFIKDYKILENKKPLAFLRSVSGLIFLINAAIKTSLMIKEKIEISNICWFTLPMGSLV